MAQITLNVSSQNRPYHNYGYSGDFILVKQINDAKLFFIGDVSGHGKPAYILSGKILRFISNYQFQNYELFFKELHEFLLGSVGCVLGLISLQNNLFSFYSVGNITLKHFSINGYTSHSGSDGVLGSHFYKIFIKNIIVKNGDVLVLQSDGVMANYNQEDYISILSDTPQEIVKNIICDFGKLNDDASCLVMKVQNELVN